MGMGHPVIGRALARGMRPSLSCDVISSNSGACPGSTQPCGDFMRATLTVWRFRLGKWREIRIEQPKAA